MSTELAVDNGIGALNALIMNGDMSKLTPQQKLDYYHGICKSIGLNPLTNPFQYMRLNGKDVLYATKGAAEQIRNIKGISITKSEIEFTEDLVIVTVEGKDRDGRVDTEVGFAALGPNIKGELRGNAILKAQTKAKRRLTLSMAGLGMLDETEVDSIPGAQKIEAEVIHTAKPTRVRDIIDLYQEPFKHKLTKRGELNNWNAWARTFWASLEMSPDEEFERWIELNAETLELCKVESPEIYEKLNDRITNKLNVILDKKIMIEQL